MASSIMVGPSAESVRDIPVEPDGISWGLQDISGSDAGRVEDYNNTMHKMLLDQKRKLGLTWVNITAAQASAILQAFNAEYFFVRYFDLLDGRFGIREFYAGDRSAPFRQINLKDKDRTVVSTLSFDIVER